MFLYKVVESLQKEKIPFALAGGFAVALHGAVRGTVDLDLVVALSFPHLSKVEQALAGLGLKSRLPVSAKEISDFREEYIKNRNLIAWNFYHPNDPTQLVDILLTHDARKMKSITIVSQGHSIPVLSIDELIKMKKVSGRPQDLLDIAALKELKK